MRFALLVTLVLIAGSSCASTRKPYSSGRAGLLDRMARLEPAERARPAPRDARWMAKLQGDSGAWSWPVPHVEVTSAFGKRNGDYHDGIDLRAKTGTPVFAAQGGRVIYAGARIGGYGRMVVLRHDSGLSTVYAHNSKLTVKRGERVRRGQVISYSGNTGRSSGPHVHFEVRDGTSAVDPMLLLAKAAPAASPVKAAHVPVASVRKRFAKHKRQLAAN